MTKRTNVQVTVFNGSQYESDGWPPEDPRGFMQWFQDRIERIPPEFRAGAKIEIGSQSGYYDSHTANIEITYQRPETDEQMAARIERDRLAMEANEAGERAQLARLLAKHGAPSAKL